MCQYTWMNSIDFHLIIHKELVLPIPKLMFIAIHKWATLLVILCYYLSRKSSVEQSRCFHFMNTSSSYIKIVSHFISVWWISIFVSIWMSLRWTSEHQQLLIRIQWCFVIELCVYCNLIVLESTKSWIEWRAQFVSRRYVDNKPFICSCFDLFHSHR